MRITDDTFRKAGFDHGQSVARSGAKMKVRFIVDNLNHLRRVDRRGKLERVAVNFNTIISRGEDLTPAQHSYLDGIYDKTMEGAGFGAINVHSDRRKRG